MRLFNRTTGVTLLACFALASAISGCQQAADTVTDHTASYLEEQKENALTEACYAQQRLIVTGMEQYDELMESSPVSIDELVTEKILPGIPECPAGGTYTYDLENHSVTCSLHGSAQEAE